MRLQQWFCAEVLPLEPVLMRFIMRHWRDASEAADIRQDVYERVLIGATRELPRHASAYVFTVARNVLINRARRAKIVPIDLIAELEDHVADADWLTPERYTDARRQLRRAADGIERLPPRCREVMTLRKVEGFSIREVAARLNIGTDAVEQQTRLGMRALADFMLGGEGRIVRGGRSTQEKKECDGRE